MDLLNATTFGAVISTKSPKEKAQGSGWHIGGVQNILMINDEDRFSSFCRTLFPFIGMSDQVLTTFIKARKASFLVAATTVGTLVVSLVPVREREVSVHTLPSREAWLLFQQASHQ